MSDIANLRPTSARRLPRQVAAQLARLKALVVEASQQAWAIGDLVNELKASGLTVTEQAELIGGSRQRLGELRRTAAAFPKDQRPDGVDFHFCTVAARSAKRLGLSPMAVVDELVEEGIDSTRAATRYLSTRCLQQTAAKAVAAASASRGPWQRCHHADCRDVLSRVGKASVKLVVADPPYGRYGKYRDGEHTRVTAAANACDGLDDASARTLIDDMFRLAKSIVTHDGCVVLCRPGGLADPPWLMHSAERYGWECRHALAWRRGPTKLGDGRAPYTSATERLLVFAQPGVTLVNHDGSSRCDILDVPARRRSHTAADQHLFEKPVELMELLVSKHTFGGEMVVEPFGGTGPVSRAAHRLRRRWLYVESNSANFELGQRLIEREISNCVSAAG